MAYKSVVGTIGSLLHTSTCLVCRKKVLAVQPSRCFMVAYCCLLPTLKTTISDLTLAVLDGGSLSE